MAAKDVTKMKPRDLASELVKLRAEHANIFAREAELKSALKDGAEENFKEVFAGVGEVSVSAAKDKRFKGTVPALVAETFLDLSEAKQQKLVEQGLVAKIDEYTSPYYGAVTVKLF